MKSTNAIKGIIFDLDGVLLSTDHFHYLAWKSLADKLEIPFDEKVNEKLRGVSRMASFEIILSNKRKSTFFVKILRNFIVRVYICSKILITFEMIVRIIIDFRPYA